MRTQFIFGGAFQATVLDDDGILRIEPLVSKGTLTVTSYEVTTRHSQCMVQIKFKTTFDIDCVTPWIPERVLHAFDKWMQANNVRLGGLPATLGTAKVRVSEDPNLVIGRGTIYESRPQGEFIDPFDTPPAKKAECPHCYGTGFYKGFGAPCMKC